jgi:hypothetical protein
MIQWYFDARPDVDRDPELSALQGLARELAAHRLQVGMRDALPALVVDTAFPGVRLYVFVSCSGESFTWQRADNRHPVTDRAGAAEKIAAYVRLWNSTSGGLHR